MVGVQLLPSFEAFFREAVDGLLVVQLRVVCARKHFLAHLKTPDDPGRPGTEHKFGERSDQPAPYGTPEELAEAAE